MLLKRYVLLELNATLENSLNCLLHFAGNETDVSWSQTISQVLSISF